MALKATVAIGDVCANGRLDTVNDTHASVSSQVSVSVTADSRGFSGGVPRLPEFPGLQTIIQYP